jgi:hypothetical protein
MAMAQNCLKSTHFHVGMALALRAVFMRATLRRAI